MKDRSTRVTAFSKRRPRVLIVDDDEATRRLTTRLLGSMGCQAVCAESGQTALRLWRDEPGFALAIVDLSLGDMDGVELIAALRDAGSDLEVPFIIVSGTFAPDELPAGVVAALLKPTSVQELQEAVRLAILSARSGPPTESKRPKEPEAPQRSATRAKPSLARPAQRGGVVEEPARDSPRDRRRERS